ncbi:MAG: diguanylate cyclase, partial [Frankiales bacterium]|nr:diguanylate cyclase [Frankiales bacterium]
ERERADHDRGHASEDREASARQRDEAGHDRDVALHDRAASADERALDALDALTGAYLRGPGLAELDRELARADRTGEPLTVVFVDVDGLKQTNDVQGHAAGDALLRRVADALRSCLRASDVLLRYGGDEFVCVLAGSDREQALVLAGRVEAHLDAGGSGASVSLGLSEREPGDAAETMVARADAELYRGRTRRRQARNDPGPRG